MMKTRQIKIAYVIGQLTLGGTEQQLLALVKNLDPKRFKPYVICLSKKESILLEEFHHLNTPVHILGREQ